MPNIQINIIMDIQHLYNHAITAALRVECISSQRYNLLR